VNTIAAVRARMQAPSALRGPVLLAIGVAAAGDILLRLSGDSATAVASILDVVLIITPLMGLVLGTSRLHHARDVVTLMLAQPVSRRRVFVDLWWRGAVPLAAALAIGVLAPFVWQRQLVPTGVTMVISMAIAAAVLAVLSQTLAMIIALRFDDRVKALSVSLATWLLAAVLWDGVVLVVALLMADRPIELPVMMMLAANPVDLVRVMMLLGSDAAAMLGYTGAMVSRTLGTVTGRAVLGSILTLWLVIPMWWAARSFQRKDF